MRFSERKAALLAVTENIEMELFSSEEPSQVILTKEQEEKHCFHQRHLEHPLIPDCEEDQDQTQTRQQATPKTDPPALDEAKICPPVPPFLDEMEIEMEEFPPLRLPENDLVEIKSNDSSIMMPVYPNKVSRLRWKRVTPQKTGLTVKDVFCLPRGDHQASPERHTVPGGKERAALVAMGMTARITIDCTWSANQMQSRLAMLFRGRFAKQAGQRFSFTYLQCVQGSRVLFAPDTPAEGWTGEQVLRISGHGALYIHSHQDYTQGESISETPVVNSTDSCLDKASQQEGQTQPRAGSPPEELSQDLDSILRLLRQQSVDEETYVRVRRRDLLDGALRALRRPGFCFRATPIISFSEEEADGHEGPLREFFRLTLLELQQSSVFEGLPGRLLFTYDLTALEDRKYYEAGVLIGWSLAHGGPGPRCLHPALYQLMCGQNPSLEDFSWSDIVDTETQIRLQQLHGCGDVELLSPTLCDWVSSCGIPGIYSACSDDTSAIYVHLVKHYIYHRVASMISQFTEGLNSCGGLWDTIQSHWQGFVPVMTSTQRQPLTLEDFKQLCTMCYSRPDSQLRAAEEETARHWDTVLTLVSDGQADFSFEDLLAFITGADHLPPVGLPRLVSLHFYSQDAGSSAGRLPHASTCALRLFLPRAATGPADLLALLSRAVHEALGFTRLHTEGDGEHSCIEVMRSL